MTTTRRDPVASRHPDLEKREFTATAPNRLWVTDLTYVPTRAGVGHVCFIIDAFSPRSARPPPPAEFENEFHAPQTDHQQVVGIK